MTTWNYRIIKKDDCFFIHEVYSDDHAAIAAFTEKPSHPMGETLQELTNDIKHFQEALSLPILNYDEIEEYVTKTRKKKAKSAP